MMTGQTGGEVPRSSFRVCRAQSIADAANHITPKVRRFALLLAIDATTLPMDELLRGAERLLKRGAVYVCAWGPECERVHDSFDRIIVEGKLDGANDRNPIMTTWHKNEPLREAVWFFRYCAFPSEAYASHCRHWVALTIGNDAWAEEIERELSKLT